MARSFLGATLVAAATLVGCDDSWVAKLLAWREKLDNTRSPRERCEDRGSLERGRCVCASGFAVSSKDRFACPPTVDDERLVVADTNDKRLYVYDVATRALVADLPDVAMADHPGFLPLSDGRLLFVDSDRNALMIARITSVTTPSIERAIPLLGQAAHIAVDPAGEHAVVSASNAYEDGRGVLTLVTLSDGRYTHVPIATGEPGIALAGDPLTLLHRNDAPAQLEMYAYQELGEGTVAPLDVASIGLAPHGEVVAHARGKVVSATARGIDIASFDALGFGDITTVPYEANGLSGGRAFYARLSGDGRYLYSYLRDDQAGAASWSAWRNDAYIVDLEQQTATRIPFGNGLVYRLGVCQKLAAFTQYAPGGDFVHVLDADQASSTFQQIIAKIPLTPLSGAPGPDGDVWSSEAFRITALSSDCAHAFVTHGGDGKVSVIDIASARVTDLISTPSALAYGGYLVSMRTGQPLVDTIGR